MSWAGSDQSDLLDAVNAFKALLPGWWYSVCECSVSCDASCGPDRQGPDADLLAVDEFDGGFHADIPQPSTLAQALSAVTALARAARQDRRST